MKTGATAYQSIDVKQQLREATAYFNQNNFIEAAKHYSLVVKEIEEQILSKRALPDPWKIIYNKAVLNLAKCFFQSGIYHQALATLLSHLYTLNEGSFNQMTLLQAKSYFKMGDLKSAIKTLDIDNIIPQSNELDISFLEIKCWLVTLLTSDAQFNRAQEALLQINNYLDFFKATNANYSSNLNFWKYKIECYYQIALIHISLGDQQAALQFLYLAKDTYESYKTLSHVNQEDALKNIAITLQAELFQILTENGDKERLFSEVCTFNVSQEKLALANENAQSKILSAYLGYIKMLYEKGNAALAIVELNKLLEWVIHLALPPEIKYISSFLGANMYLQPNTFKPALALIFLTIGNAIKPNQFEILCLQLICHHHLGDFQNASIILNQIKTLLLKANEKDKASYLACYQQFLPLMPKVNDDSQLTQKFELLTLLTKEPSLGLPDGETPTAMECLMNFNRKESGSPKCSITVNNIKLSPLSSVRTT